jgi:DUF4097 and DUF4098 domain-containing protein YvlB
MKRQVIWSALLLGALRSGLLFAESTAEFHRNLPLEPSDHIVLDVIVPAGNLTIAYAHAGEITVAATARASHGQIPADYFDRGLIVERTGSHVRVQFNSKTAPVDPDLHVAYTINVPNWIEVNSNVGTGKQTISGVMGPVHAIVGSGDLKIQYITDTLEAKTGRGNIIVDRVGTAAKVETGAGSIRVKDVGPGSSAAVKKGTGRIEAAGIRGSFVASTDAGELKVAGSVYDHWDLQSGSGDILVSTAPEDKFDIDAATRSGRVAVENNDIEAPEDANARACHQKVNGGGKLVHIRSTSGSIVLQ